MRSPARTRKHRCRRSSSHMTEPDEDTFTSEDAQVFRHRIRRFERLGFNEQEAVELAQSTADYREAGRMISDGCPKAVVMKILL